MRKIVVFILMVFYSCQFLCSAENSKEKFLLGCDFYKKAEYKKALDQFKLVENEYPASGVFYNIGNTYFRLGKIGKALVYYERARKISPFDNDINFNIKFLAEMIKDQDYKQTFFSGVDIFLLKLFFSFSFFIFIIIISVKLFRPGKTLFWPIIGSLVFFVLFSVLYFVKYQQQKQVEAVAISNNVEIRSGPGENFKVNFTLPEGKKMIILGRSGSWLEIGVKSMGIKGWLEEQYIEVI
ncbi:MAG: tetratricopeptide repeat protein [Elusimicrobia bacterium]|nr:tetratricopeptide repeat protein [Elusimicrobiota bacterium]